MNFRKLLYLIFIFLSFSFAAQAQCDKQVIDNTFKYGLTRIKAYQYNLLKHYKLDALNGKKKEIKYSYVFSLGTKYMLTLSNSDKDIKGIKVSVYDGGNKLIASNYQSKSGKYYSAIQINCKKTGVYYIKFDFEKTRNYCAGAVLGFKR